jgi:hypothetical protein
VDDWNYTHNTNVMIGHAVEAAGLGEVEECGGPLGKAIGPAWWRRLHGMKGAEAGEFLRTVCEQMRSDPATYEAMNPPNGWGAYDSLVPVLESMRDASFAHPAAIWDVCG